MESIKITPGFCPNCGSILPHLRPTGKVKCYNCLTDWPPEGKSLSLHNAPRKVQSALILQCLATWELSTPFHSMSIINGKMFSWRKRLTKGPLWSAYVRNAATIKCLMQLYNFAVLTKDKQCFTHAQTASKLLCTGYLSRTKHTDQCIFPHFQTQRNRELLEQICTFR